VNTILLDAGGVLVWPNWHRVADALRARGVAAEAVRLAAGDPHARHALDTAAIVSGSTDGRRGADYFRFVLTHAGVPLSPAVSDALADVYAYHQRTNLWEHVPAFVVPALGALRARGYRLAVVSNSNGTLRGALARLGLDGFFDAILDSAEEQVEKPDPRLFERALARVGAAAAEAIHVGDLYNVDVVGARAAGVSAVLVDEAGLTRDPDCPCIRSIAELPDLVAAWAS